MIIHSQSLQKLIKRLHWVEKQDPTLVIPEKSINLLGVWCKCTMKVFPIPFNLL